MKKSSSKTAVRCPHGKNKSIDRADESNPGSSDESPGTAERSSTLPTHYYSIPTKSQHKAVISYKATKSHTWRGKRQQYRTSCTAYDGCISSELCHIHWYCVLMPGSVLAIMKGKQNLLLTLKQFVINVNITCCCTLLLEAPSKYLKYVLAV